MADPKRRADVQTVFWLPERLPSLVILTPCDVMPEAGIALRFAPAYWPGLIGMGNGPAGIYVTLGDGTRRYRLWLPARPPYGAPLAVTVPVDGVARVRAAAAQEFCRYMTAGATPRAGPALAPRCASRRHRSIALTLAALDAYLNGASYREIATMLHGPARVADAPWKTSPLRDATIRQVRRGLALMRGDYVKLLSAGPH